MLRKGISTYISRSIACRRIVWQTLVSLLLVLLFPTVCLSQNNRGGQRLSKDEQLRLRMKAIDDSIPLWRGFQVKVDIVGPIQKAVSSYGQFEAGIRFNLKDKYFPVVELGYGKADENNDVTQITYKTSAPYGKLGIDFNVMKNKHDIYRLYAGVRYAYTSFKFDVDHAPLTDPVWGGRAPFETHDIKANYGWLEALFGIDAKITGPLHLGWTVRYKRRLNHDDGTIGNVWYVPGFGKQGGSRIGGTFEIMFDI